MKKIALRMIRVLATIFTGLSLISVALVFIGPVVLFTLFVTGQYPGFMQYLSPNVFMLCFVIFGIIATLLWATKAIWESYDEDFPSPVVGG